MGPSKKGNSLKLSRASLRSHHSPALIHFIVSASTSSFFGEKMPPTPVYTRVAGSDVSSYRANFEGVRFSPIFAVTGASYIECPLHDTEQSVRAAASTRVCLASLRRRSSESKCSATENDLSLFSYKVTAICGTILAKRLSKLPIGCVLAGRLSKNAHPIA